MSIAIHSYTDLHSGIAYTLLDLERKIFPSPLTLQIMQKEIEGKKDLLILIADHDGLPCGYKVGFQHSPEIFYSWIGGVDPAFRRQGIARSLMAEQHQILKEMGYKFVRTHTKNKYREMLILNIGFGFDVTGTQKKLREAEHSIILEKEL